jgi:eukaryotic-like serine/threonine-protein kinase
MKIFFQFLISKIFWLNVLIAIILFVFLAWLTLFSLGLFTKHGEAISVPDLNGMTLEEVKAALDENNLRFEVIDSVYLTSKKKGTIVDQSPSPNFKVKENRKIFLTMNATLPERVHTPELVGVSLKQATANLETYGLRVGSLKYVPDIGKNVVLKQLYKGKEIKRGELVNKGEAIDLVLGMGASDEKTSVPFIIGLKISEASIKLNENFLNIGAIICDETVKSSQDSAKAKIWKQAPVPNKNVEIKMGSSIDIWITNKTELIPTDSSSVINNNEDELDIEID